jgi:acylphosphatase
MPTVHMIVSGRVQGVFYRASAKQLADELNICGWIKNTPDGNVEILATGDRSDLIQFVNWCKQGPPKADVKNVSIENKEEIDFDAFTIKRY